MTNNIAHAQLAITKAERAVTSIAEDNSGVRVALSHPDATVAMYFTTPADAWKFAKAVEAFAVKLMTPEVQG